MDKKCLKCNKVLTNKQKKYCSVSCRNSAIRVGKHSWNYGLNQFNDKRIKRVADSKRGKHHAPQTEFQKGHIPTTKGNGNKEECDNCGKIFFKPKCHIGKNKCCSKDCLNEWRDKNCLSRIYGKKKMKIFYNKRRKLRKLQNGGTHTIEEWENLKKEYDYMCPSCFKQEPEIKLTEDHILPISFDGSDAIENIQPMCLSCNDYKFTKTYRCLKPKMWGGECLYRFFHPEIIKNTIRE